MRSWRDSRPSFRILRCVDDIMAWFAYYAVSFQSVDRDLSLLGYAHIRCSSLVLPKRLSNCKC